jgi:hypothetical protein
MEAVAPSENAVAVLRAISRAGFEYAATKALCEDADWRLVDDEPDLGYVRYNITLAASSPTRRPLSVLIAERNQSPWAFVPLFYFEEYDQSRASFDQAFQTLEEQLTGFLGAATRSGEYSYPHRVGWPYSFAGWSLVDATLLLVQDEYDIQFGMDITLWVQARGTAIQAPVKYE